MNARKSKDLRFLKKILTDSEIERVAASADPDAALWSFWACKEAAYKVLNKQTGRAVFMPRRWSVCFRGDSPVAEVSRAELPKGLAEGCDPTVFSAGDVLLEDKHFVPVRLFNAPTYVHCLAADRLDVLNLAVWRVEILPEGYDQQGGDASLWVRSCLVRDLSEHLRVEERLLEIRRVPRNNGELQPPAVYYKGAPAGVDVSLSHDGDYVAYAFMVR